MTKADANSVKVTIKPSGSNEFILFLRDDSGNTIDRLVASEIVVEGDIKPSFPDGDKWRLAR